MAFFVKSLRFLIVVCLCLFLTACGQTATKTKTTESSVKAQAPEPSPQMPAKLQEAELARTAYIEAHQLPSGVSIDELKQAIHAKSSAMNEVTNAYLAVRDAHPDYTAQAAARVGFLHLEFACDLLSAPPTSTKEELAGWQGSVEQHAKHIIEQGMDPLRTAFELGVAPWSDQADRMVQLWYTTTPPLTDFCRVASEQSAAN